MEVFIVQLYGHFITGRTSYIQWMFSKEAGTGGRAVEQQGSREGTALALLAGGGYGTVEQQADWLRLGGQGREPTHTHTHSQYSEYQ